MSKRTNNKKLQEQFRGLLNCTSCALALAATISLAGPAFAADVPTSTNLPVANYVNGATLQYNNGVTVQTNMGGLVTNQAIEKTAADSAAKLNINVTNNVADIGYNSFNIAKNKNVNFNFNNPDQVALNRVTPVGASYASKIYGSITQTGASGGSVFLINPNGILFGANSSVNLNSFTASTFKVKDNDLGDADRQIELLKTGTPAGIYFEGPGNIATNQSAVFAANAIFNKNKNIQANNNMMFITGEGTTLQVYNNGVVGFPADDETGHDYVIPTGSNATTVTLPNNLSVQLGEISLKAGKLTTPNLTVIAKMDKDLQAQYKDIVNISSVIQAGNVFMYANNAKNDVATNGQLNINVSAIKSTNPFGNIEITTDGKINANDIYTQNGHVWLGTNNLFNGFGPSDELSDNMAVNYRLSGLIGDSIKTGNIFAGDLIAIGKSINTKNITTKGSAILAGVDTLTVDVNNTVYPFGVALAFKGGAVTTRNIQTGDDLVIIGSTIKAGMIESQGAVIIAAINSLNLDISSDATEATLCLTGGTVDIDVIETEPGANGGNNLSLIPGSPIAVFGNNINVDYVHSETNSTAALIAVNKLNADALIDPELFSLDSLISPWMTGNIITPEQIVTLANGPFTTILTPAPQFVEANLGFQGGTITGKSVEADNVVLLGANIDLESVTADDLALILGIKSADLHLDAGQYLPNTINFEGNIVGGNIDISDILPEDPFTSNLVAIELGAKIVNDNVTASTFAALGIESANLEFQFTEGNVLDPATAPQAIISLLGNNTANQGYIAAKLEAINGTVSVNSIIADTAILLGKEITTDYLNVTDLIKIELPSIEISYNEDDAYSY